MKILNLSLLLVVTLVLSTKITAQDIPVIHKLCYTQTNETIIKVSPDFNPQKLTFAEKLIFRVPSFTKKITEVVTSSDFTFDIEYLEHKNLVPKYVRLPYLTRTNNTGSTSFFHKNNPSYKGGWIGSVFLRNPSLNTGSTVYKEDNQRKLYTKYEPRPKGDTQWNEIQQENYKTGLIHKFVWQKPNLHQLQYYLDNGYTVLVNNLEYVVISNHIETITWNLTNKTITIEIVDDQGTLTNTIIKSYVYNHTLDLFLISTEIEIEYLTFEYGDCYSSVNTTTFTDIDTNCDQAQFRESDDDYSIQSQNELNIYPNPVHNSLTVNLPNLDQGTIEVLSMNGEQLHVRNVKGKLTCEIDVTRYPKGIYTIRFIQNDQIFNTKFVKQ